MASWDPDGPGPLPGALVAGGEFTVAGRALALNIALWDGQGWTPLGEGLDGRVNALCVYGGEVIAGGLFSASGGQPLNRIARWNGTAWQSVGDGVAGGTTPTVNALIVHGSDLIVAGGFTQVGGQAAANIATWNGAAWGTLGAGVTVTNALATYGGAIVAGGGGVRRWNGTAWQTLGTGMNGPVNALVGHGGFLIAGGNFNTANGTFVSKVARWNGTSWQAMGNGISEPIDSFAVNGLYSTGSELHAVGNFRYANQQDAAGIARWNGTQWEGLGLANQLRGITVPVTGRAITQHAGGLVVGGDAFHAAGSAPVSSIAHWNGLVWQPLAEQSGVGLNAPAYAVGTFMGDLVAGGIFAGAGGQLAGGVARLDGDAWSPLGSGVGTPQSLSSPVAMIEFDGKLVVTGFFPSAGGVPAANIAQWDGAAWGPLGSGLGDDGRALAIYDGALIVGGAFSTAGGAPATNIARWDGAAWSPIGSGVGGNIASPSAECMVVMGTDLIVGGQFLAAGGIAANRIACWNGTQWSPLASGMNNRVDAVAVYNGDLVASGVFTSPASRIARWNGTNWSALGSGLTGGTTPTGAALLMYGDDLICGGLFTTAGGQSANNLARWDGAAWHAMGAAGGGVAGPTISSTSSAWISSLTIHSGDLVIGGSFATAGGQPSAYVARWGCPPCYPDCNASNSLTIADFGCFQTAFANGDPYADCNQSTTLTIADFACFQAAFAAGCP